MDEMKIRSKIFTGMLSKIISKNLKKQTNIDCDINIGEILLKNDGNIISIKIDIEGSVKTTEFSEIFNKFIKI